MTTNPVVEIQFSDGSLVGWYLRFHLIGNGQRFYGYDEDRL